MESFKELALSLLEKSENFKKIIESQSSASEKCESTDETLIKNNDEEDLQAAEKKEELSNEGNEYSVKDIASITNIPEWTLRRKIKNGELKAHTAEDSKNPGKARFVVLRDDLREFLDSHADKVTDSREKEENLRFKALFDTFIEEFDDVIEYGKLEIKRDEIDMKTQADDNLRIQREIIEKQMMIKRLEIEKKLYKNTALDEKVSNRSKPVSFMDKVKDYLNGEF